MQVWNQVKVSDVESEHAGEAGLVQSVRKEGDAELCTVRLDSGPVVEFHATALQYLG